MRVIFKPVKAFGTVNAIGVHQIADCKADVDNAFYNAERDGFEAIYFYVADLSLVRFARLTADAYEQAELTGTDA